MGAPVLINGTRYNTEYLANREAIVSVYTKGNRCNSIAYNSIT